MNQQRRAGRAPRPKGYWPVRLGSWLLVTLTTACGSLPETHYYVLASPQGATQEAGTPPGDGITVGVEAFTVDPPYDQDRLVYRVGAGSPEVGFYAYHRWASPLDRLAPVALAAGLEDLPGVAVIEPARANVAYTARLQGRLLYLEEVDLAQSQLVRIKLHLKLVDSSGGVLWSQEVASESGLRTDKVADIVLQMQRAFADLLLQVKAGLGPVLRRHGTHHTPGERY